MPHLVKLASYQLSHSARLLDAALLLAGDGWPEMHFPADVAWAVLCVDVRHLDRRVVLGAPELARLAGAALRVPGVRASLELLASQLPASSLAARPPAAVLAYMLSAGAVE